MKTSLSTLKTNLNNWSFRMRMGLLVLAAKLLVVLINLKNKIPLLKKTQGLESLLRKTQMSMANLIGDMINASVVRVENRLHTVENRIRKSTKKPLKTKAKVASKAKKPRKAAKAKTIRK